MLKTRKDFALDYILAFCYKYWKHRFAGARCLFSSFHPVHPRRGLWATAILLGMRPHPLIIGPFWVYGRGAFIDSTAGRYRVAAAAAAVVVVNDLDNIIEIEIFHGHHPERSGRTADNRGGGGG